MWLVHHSNSVVQHRTHKQLKKFLITKPALFDTLYEIIQKAKETESIKNLIAVVPLFQPFHLM